jgi:hypothetical protein
VLRVTTPRVAFLALMLLFASSAPVWMMSGALAQDTVATTSPDTDHCADPESAAAGHQGADQSPGCPCCVHGACLCWNGCGAMIVDVAILPSIESESQTRRGDRPSLPAPALAEHLRPPIA